MDGSDGASYEPFACNSLNIYTDSPGDHCLVWSKKIQADLLDRVCGYKYQTLCEYTLGKLYDNTLS